MNGSNKSQRKFNAEWLRNFKGLEDIEEVNAEHIIETLVSLARITHNVTQTEKHEGPKCIQKIREKL